MRLRPGLRVKLLSGYLTALLLMAAIGYVWLDERRDYRAREDEYARINRSREEALGLYARLVGVAVAARRDSHGVGTGGRGGIPAAAHGHRTIA